ncbi:hypothetical protein HOI18_04555 [Candidatus Uhrbacteria bacterium]|jgi:hypothetical protein|nr:hypothetical protein [Candidatus Uhrbacteria bacterium]
MTEHRRRNPDGGPQPTQIKPLSRSEVKGLLSPDALKGDGTDLTGAVEKARSGAQKVAEIREMGEMKTMREVRDIDGENGQLSKPGAVAAYGALRLLEGGEKMITHTPQRKLSSLFHALESKGTAMIKKNAGWLKHIPFVGGWLVGKPEKTLAEKDKDEAKKQKQEAARAKKKNEQLKNLTDTGLTKKQAEALLSAAAAEKEDEKKSEPPAAPPAQKAA